MKPRSLPWSVAALGLAALASAGAQAPPGDHPRLRDILRSYGIPVDRARAPDADARMAGYVIENAGGSFAIAFFGESPDSLHVGTWNRATQRWMSAVIDLPRLGVPDMTVGSLVAIEQSTRTVLIDTHLNPSAGTLIVLSRSLAPITTLPGWVLRVLPTGVVLYERNNVHFAPTHWAELWTWDPPTRRDRRLYPNAPFDSVRRAYVDTVRAIYRRVGADWFRANNHHMDPARFDSQLGDSVVVDSTGRTISFTVTFGGGEGTPAETPRVEVAVVCRNVGTSQARCRESGVGSESGVR